MKASKVFTPLFLILILGYTNHTFSQTLKWNNKEFELKNVTASVVEFHGEKVLKVKRDLKALPFDSGHLEATVDNAQYVKLKIWIGKILYRMISEHLIIRPACFWS